MRRPLARAVITAAIAALALSACAPSASPPPPPTVSCNGISASTGSPVVEKCHNNYKSYKLDTSSSYAQQRADYIATYFPTRCNGNLAAYHVTGSQLMSAYPGSSAVAENLYCYWSSAGCASANFGATKAMNGWLASSGHKANLDNFAGAWVNSASACVSGRNVFIAVAQFHR